MPYIPNPISGVCCELRAPLYSSLTQRKGASHDDAVEVATTTLGPNSPNSSFAEASVSQRSQLDVLSGGFPQPVKNDAGRDVATPSTSLSNYSSQVNAPRSRRINDNPHSMHDERDMAYLDATDPGDEKAKHSRVEHTVGLKRTATGQFKSPTEGLLSPSPVDPNEYSHSRNTSTTSRSSHIGEVRSSAIVP